MWGNLVFHIKPHTRNIKEYMTTSHTTFFIPGEENRSLGTRQGRERIQTACTRRVETGEKRVDGGANPGTSVFIKTLCERIHTS